MNGAAACGYMHNTAGVCGCNKGPAYAELTGYI